MCILLRANDVDIVHLKFDIEMKQAKLNITIKGDLQDFLGVNIKRKDNGTIHLTQPHLIHQILKDLRRDRENVTETSSKLLSI
jgi:hypothetical protein